MFPNVRLMIAATFVSVVALICGFGVFAALRVGHEPLVRLPHASAPLQLVTNNAVTPITLAAPFDHRFQIGASASGSAISALAYSTADPVEQPPTSSAVAAADDQEHDAVEPEPPPPTPADSADSSPPSHETPVAEAAVAEVPVAEVPVAEAAQETELAETAAASPPEPAPRADENAAMASASSDPPVAAVEQDIKASVASAAIDQAVPWAPAVATVEPLANPPLPLVRPNLEGKAGFATSSTVDEAEKKNIRGRAANNVHRAHRIAAVTQFSQFSDRSFAFSESDFQTAAPALQAEWAQKHAAKTRHAKITSTTPKAPNSAVGGPFVSAPGR
jgi:hypothetical protein